MQKTERELTDIEIIDTFFDIINLIISTYGNPIREEFKRKSRCEQLGYDIIKLLMSRNIIMTGKKEAQIRLEETKQKNGEKS